MNLHNRNSTLLLLSTATPPASLFAPTGLYPLGHLCLFSSFSRRSADLCPLFAAIEALTSEPFFVFAAVVVA
jgi:hypothetical protein